MLPAALAMRISLLLVTLAVAAPLAQVRSDDRDGGSTRFEVASVKRNTQVSPLGSMAQYPGGRFAATNMPLRQVILTAYQLQPLQLIDAPDWIRTERFDIEARARTPFPLFVPSGEPNPLHAMLRALLTERFGLVVRREMRELPIFALMPVRQGQPGRNLRASSVDCAAVAEASGGALPSAAPGERPVCGAVPGFGRVIAGAATLSDLIAVLAPQVDRPIVDRTGMIGRFDIDLQWTPDNLPRRSAGAPPDQPIRVNGIDIDPNGPSLFTALREQLGLMLMPADGPVPVIVVERVERPTPD